LDFRDLIVTPLFIMMVYVMAYFVRPYATDEITRRYFFPLLSLKIIGAIALGLIYQFYYDGGDTFNYHTKGSRVIWEAITEDFEVGIKMLFSNGELVPGAYKYISRIPFYQDPPSFAVIRIATFFDLLTFSTYSATAVIFSVVSFFGSWAIFITFYKKYQSLHLQIAYAILFIPSVIFWGSGLLKDTLVLASLGFSVYFVDKVFIQHRVRVLTVAGLLISLFIIFSIKKFVLQAFIPSVMLWIYFKHLSRLKSVALKVIVAPVIVIVFLLTAYYSVIKVGEGDSKYSIERIAKTAQITAYDIGFYTGGNAGSNYSLGELDGSFSSMIRLAPQAINVSLFRPYFWEVRNPLMLLSAVEAFVFLIITLYIIVKKRPQLFGSFGDPNVIFCLVFSISFAFAVGVSTFNFGTLARYKIPLMPFYALALVLILNYENKDRKFEELEETE